MSQPEASDGGPLPLTQFAQIVGACDRFEAEWRAGRRPRIEQYLAEASEPYRSALLRELLELELELRRGRGERPEPGEYRARFPEHSAVVDAAIEAQPADRAPAEQPEANRPRADVDRGLLLGLLALQNNFIDRDALLGAFAAWVADKARPLGLILLERGALDADTHALLEALARKHLDLHGDDPERSLAALSSLGPVRGDLERIADPELHASLAHVASDRGARDEPEATITYSTGQATSSAGRFRILRPHARGGLGEVYVARDEELKREVALKRIRDEHADDPHSRSRFVVEAEITGGLEHPAIIPIYGLGTYDDGRPFYAMRFIKGDSLKQAIKRFHGAGGPGRDPGARSLELRKLLRRFLDVCNAVAYAHSRGVLHRDLKPGNVLLGPYGETLVVDWGLAKVIGRPEGSDGSEEGTLRPASAGGSSETLPGSALGTPAYMSPEQAAGELDRLGPASDVYSLGATLYHLLTGRVPFEGSDAADLRAKVIEGDFPPPRQVHPGVPVALDAICRRAMAREPRGRYATPHALAEDVEHWLADEPVAAYREGWGPRLARWGRHHRPIVAGLAALLVTAVVALSVSTVLIGRETARKEEQRRLAELNFTRARDAVDQMLTEVAEVELADVPQMQPVRRRLLEKAQRFYLNFLEQKRDDPSVRRETARAHVRLGEIEETLGSHAGAEPAYRRGIEILQALVDQSPGWDDARRDLAGGEHDLGVFLKKANRFRESEAALRAALDRRERLAREHPDDPGDCQALADSRYHLGALVARLRRERRAEEESAYREALRLQEALVAASRDRPESRRKLARYLNNLAILLRDTGRTHEAEDDWREAIEIQRGPIAGPFASPGDRWQLARSLSNLAVLLRETKRPDEAETMGLEARKLQEGLVTDFPDVPEYRNDLASTLHNLGLLWRDTKPPAAVEALSEAIGLREALVADFRGIPEYRQRLAVTRLNLASMLKETDRPRASDVYGQALEAQEQLVADFPNVPEYQVALGRTLYSLARLQIERNDLAQARALLGRAIGYHRAALESDPRDWTCREFLRDDQGVLCLALIRSGAYEQAADAAEELTRIMPGSTQGIMPGSAQEWLRAAIFLVECASAAKDEQSKDAFAGRAVALLRRAAERRVVNDPEVLRVEELKPIRDREDFQKLRDDLANRAKIQPG